MGTHTVHADCVKCTGKDSLIYAFDTRNPISGEAFCLNCGRYYSTIEKKPAKKELAGLRKEYGGGD